MNIKTIICTQCKKPTKEKLTDPKKLKADFTVYCKNCLTELEYVDGDDFTPKYNLWAIRTQTAKILRQ